MSQADNPKPIVADILAFAPDLKGCDVAVPVKVTLPGGRDIKTAIWLDGAGVSAAELDRRREWVRWAAETLRPELVDELARSYLPHLKDFAVDHAVEQLVRAREQLLRLDGVSRPLSPEDLAWAKKIVGAQLSISFDKSDSAWRLACHTLIWYTLNVWSECEKTLGPGAIAQLRAHGRLQGIRSIASDRFAVVTGPRFRDSVPALVQDTLREMQLRSLWDVEVVLGLPVDDPGPFSVPQLT
jgi:hypothetical protein